MVKRRHDFEPLIAERVDVQLGQVEQGSFGRRVPFVYLAVP